MCVCTCVCLYVYACVHLLVFIVGGMFILFLIMLIHIS